MRTHLLHREFDTDTKRRTKHRLPVLQAMCELGSGYVAAGPTAPRFGAPSETPYVAILEDRFPSVGPDFFDLPSLRSVMGKARGVMVLPGEPSPDPYRRTATLLLRGVSTVMVETTQEHAEEWRSFARDVSKKLLVVIIR